jgi:hypothetical protein
MEMTRWSVAALGGAGKCLGEPTRWRAARGVAQLREIITTMMMTLLTRLCALVEGLGSTCMVPTTARPNAGNPPVATGGRWLSAGLPEGAI